jgi:hypothetical protein
MNMKRRRPPAPLTVLMILTWADAHRARTGKLPDAYSGRISWAPLGTNWRQIDNALPYGLRGLPGGSSVAKLLADHREYRNHMGLTRLNGRTLTENRRHDPPSPNVAPLLQEPHVGIGGDLGVNFVYVVVGKCRAYGKSAERNLFIQHRIPGGHCC